MGALWSGLLMLVVGVHAFDGWKLHRQDRPSLAAGWLSLALIMAIFSLDEIGSLHERVNLLLDDTWIELVPFAMVLIALYAHMSIAFLKHQDHQKLWIWITGAFVLFASVALQEYVEHRISWPDSWRPIRTSAEEGSELVASLLLLWIAMRKQHATVRRTRNPLRARAGRHHRPARLPACVRSGRRARIGSVHRSITRSIQRAPVGLVRCSSLHDLGTAGGEILDPVEAFVCCIRDSGSRLLLRRAVHNCRSSELDRYRLYYSEQALAGSSGRNDGRTGNVVGH